ncbi:MAG: hypothetical protein IKQ03_03495 [Prevotella sp.]|nr:hypothetical protein [Prevotella sp.]
MTTVKRLFILLIALLGCSSGAWAIEQDSDGYYLIGSVQDWKDFAALVQTTPTANAKMIADVDLGDDQTTIGSPRNRGTLWYQGTFDGDGHTLTIAYDNTSGEVFTTPFTLIQGATIKNLHLDGTVNTSYAYGGSIASIGRGSNTLKNIWNSVTSVCTMGGWDQMGAFFGVLDGSGASMDVIDCLFTGSMSHPGGYSGYFSGGYGPGPQVSNCLVLGEFTGDYGFNGTFTNCYLKHASTTGVTIPSDEQLADGTIATALGDSWVQDPLTKQPTLKIFATLKQDADGYYLIGSVQDWKNFAELVNSGTNTAANAKMVADVDLGGDQTMIGSGSINASDGAGNVVFKGTFDGQGHTLTVNYNNSETFVAPFRFIFGATIKNIHVKGSVTGSGKWLGGIVASVVGRNIYSYLEKCYSSVSVTSTNSPSDNTEHIGGIVSQHAWESKLSLTDCIFDGTLKRKSANKTMSGLVGCSDGVLDINNCISLGSLIDESDNPNRVATFAYPWTHGSLNAVNSYYYNAFGTLQGTQATDGDISDGTTAEALQADRSEEIWVQDPVLGIPMLKIFANEETEQPSDALNGVFTINASGEKVSFSKGNLQKIGSTYQFAEHQYDYFGKNQSDTQRDMFSFNNFSTPNSDDNWFNMTHDQWVYLLRDRSVNNSLSDGACFTMATLGGTYKGVILFPDNYTHPEGTGFTPGVFNSYSNYTAQVSLEGWALMEAAGCVFLPSCGWKSKGNEWKSVGETAVYSSTTVCSDDVTHFYTPCFYVDRINFDGWCHRESWAPVRLVMRLQPLTYTVPSSGVGTFSSEVNIHLPEGLNAHYCKTYYAERSAISVVNISSGVVPANTGVLLSGTPGETFNLYPTPETADELEGNALVAVVESQHIAATDGDHTNFMMSGGKFIRIADDGEDVKMPANRAYLPLLTEAISGSNAKEIMLYWGTTTGIESLASSTPSKGEGSIYNLNGQKLSSPLKGINIINGRKVIVK